MSDSEFSLPWHQAMLGYARALEGEIDGAVKLLEEALEKSKQIYLPYLTPWISVLLAETLAPSQPKRALEVAEFALGVARARAFRVQEAELLRVKAAALLSIDCEAAEASAQEGYELAKLLGLDPEQGHGLRTLGDIFAAKGDTTRAEDSRAAARAKYVSLGMRRWSGAQG